MLRFLKNLFANPYDKAAVELSAEIKSIEPEKIEPEKIQPDISEPVLSFVNCVKQNHRRFILDYKDTIEVEEGKQIVVCYKDKTRVFKDRITGEQWIWSYRPTYCFKRTVIWGCDFLTCNEKEYILKELGDFYRQRLSRLAEIRRIRRNRKNVIERERLKGVYCQ